MASEIEANVGVPPTRLGEPAWAIAALFPLQGNWSERDYFRLESDKFVELVDGCIEVLPMPTLFHQRILQWLWKQFEAWCEASQIGEAFIAPVPMKLFSGTIREPDLFLIPRQQGSPLPQYPKSALFVLEVVSEGAEARQRDYVQKRDDYAKAGIPEYWIVDPIDKAVTVLRLEGAQYKEHGRYEQKQTVIAATLEGFSVECERIWALENQA
jgi:Uma2 family endonuclease